VNLINRYIFKEVLNTFIVVLSVMASVFLSHRFARYLAESVAGNITADILAILVGFDFLSSLMLLIPIALFFSVLMSLGRLYKDSEMFVMSACGISQWQILYPILWLGMFFALVVGALSMYVTPWALGKIETMQIESKSVSQFTGIQPGQFKLFQAGKRVFYFEEYAKNNVMRSVMVYQSGKTGSGANLVTADSGRFVTDKETGAVMLILRDGYQYQGEAGRSDFRITQFHENAIRIQQRSQSPKSVRRAAQPTHKLLQSNRTLYQAEFHWRIALPIGTLILVLLAVPLSKTTPRHGQFGKIFIAILVYIAYNNLIGVGRNWIAKSVVPMWFGLWWVHILFFTAAIVMIHTANGGRLWRKKTNKKSA